MAKALRITCRADRTGIVEKAAEILARSVTERAGVPAGQDVKGGAEVVLDVRAGIGAEGFRIEDGPKGNAVIVGNDERGLLYGVGKFLRASRFDDGGFTPGAWRGASVPQKDVRGMYFATHFHNFYHDGPVEKVQRYVEDLALWGCNTLSVWFDMHHFNGIADPAAQAMIERLRAILQAARAVGMRPALTTLSNEAYANSPEELRADWTAGHDGYTSPPGGHYHVEICPNKPGGLDLILRLRREMLEAFQDLDIGCVWIWPYDQGGCTCARCAPWGANGFLKTARAEAGVIRECCPDARIVLSTWYFDRFTSGEWAGLDAVFRREKPDWADYLMADDYGSRFPEYPLKHGVPGGLPMITFPEISMLRMWPWGGYGMNPLPAHLQGLWDQCAHAVQGGFPYSEGIFEDMNKAIMFQLWWDPARKAGETVREYVAAEFSPDAVDELARAAEMMEADHGHSLTPGDKRAQLGGKLYELPNLKHARQCLTLVEAAQRKLTPQARASWRWRTFYLRAAIDAELQRSGGLPTERSDAFFDELVEIYSAQHAEFSVAPPGRRTIARMERGG